MWDIRYRPKRFSEVLGQEGNVKLLKARLSHGTAFDKSYLFIGGHGQGKTTLARIHARAMLCLNLSKEDPEPCNECENCIGVLNDQSEAFSERDAASQGKIEHIRALVERLGYAVSNARMRIELFDEAHRIGDGAQDVLLKPLEERKLVGMFCTTEPNKIKGTIRTRCEEYVIRKVTREDVLERARFVCQSEGVPFQDDALLTIIDSSGGHIRDILNKMEMVSQIGEINLENTREYLHLGSVSVYYDILLALHDAPRAIELTDRACENVGAEEVAAGIAEAAMNSYRLANGMFAEFTYVDRGLGQKVYERYNTGTIKLAEYFLKDRYVSRVSLMRDVLVCVQTVGNVPNADGVGPALILSAPSAIAPAPVADVTPVVAAPSLPVATPVPAPAALPNTSTAASTKGGVAPDPHLHPGDKHLVGTPLPRRRDDHLQNHMAFDKRPDDDEPQLLPDEWRREFWSNMPTRGTNA